MQTTKLVAIRVVLFTVIACGGLQNSSRSENNQGATTDSGSVRLVLPPTIYATPGVECNIYFDNIILALNANNYAFDVASPVGQQLQERWTFTPTAKDVGRYSISIEVRNDSDHLAAHGRSTIQVAAPPLLSEPATLLIVGDSLTEASVYPRQVLELSRRCGSPLLRLIGSRGAGNMPPTDGLRFEGYSGWTATAFATLAGPLSRSGYFQRGATGSPFVYEAANGTKELNFRRYCSEFNNGSAPDLVTIGLGTNDIFTATDDNIDTTIDRMFVHYDAILAAIQKFNAETRIGVQLIIPPSTSQDGFRNYVGAGRQTRWQYRRNQHRLIERMLSHFGKRTDQHIYVVPDYLNIDAAHAFPTWSPPINARSEQKMTRVNNGIHPSAAGYEQIGDTIYSWVVNILATAHGRVHATEKNRY